jgi:hypothetical protein
MLRSLGRFVWIVVCRHKLLALCVFAGLWWRWHASSPPAASHPQAAVLADGFAAIDSSNRVVEFDPGGARRRELTIRGIVNPRLVGFGSGLGVVWRDGRRVAAADVDAGGTPGRPMHFGKDVQMMCKGTASNAHRFAVGWTEPDGAVWIVFGPTSSSPSPSSSSSSSPSPSSASWLSGLGSGELGDGIEATVVDDGQASGSELARPTFCAVASADRKVGLLWGEGNKVSMTLCDKKCPSVPTAVRLEKGRELLGFGCIRDACMIAARNGRTLEATWVSLRGKPQWTRPLRDATPDSPVELVGTGTQIAIAYATGNEPVVVAASRTGELAPVWQGAADEVPSIQWADGRLVIARHVAGHLVGSVVSVP